jgi:plastocyanin
MSSTSAEASATAAAAGGASAAVNCVWKRHSKRIVKRVKRRGRVRRVRRVKRWWTCRPVPAAPAPAPAPPPPLPPPPIEPGEGEPTVARLGVKAFEYGYTLSRPSIPPGDVIVELNNAGEDPHNLNLRREGVEESPLEIPETESLERRSGRFTLPAGTYRLWCSLPYHDELGMNATLVVAD